MKISVIIPTYNRADMLVYALESLKKQSFHDFEVIIVDDGSTDRSKEIISMYEQSLKMKYLSLVHSGNIARLRNQGILHAEGEYLAFLDSDDWCQENRLELQYRYHLQNNDCGISATWVYVEDYIHNEITDKIEGLYNMKNDQEEIIKRCLNEGCCICNSTVMMKKELLEKLGGYDEEMYICEDFNLWIRAFLANIKIDIISHKLVHRRIHNNSVTAGYSGGEEAIRLIIRNKLQYLCGRGKLNREICIWGKNDRSCILIEELLKVGRIVKEGSLIDFRSEENPNFNKNAFQLVTTFSHKEDVFSFFIRGGLNIMEDYIYI